MKSINIAERRVGSGEPTYIIAELGSNHDRSFTQAERLIDAAVAAGADCVKFQLYTASDLYPESSPVFELVRNTELPPEWLPELARKARESRVHFMATPFSARAVDRLAELGVPAFKWASSETVNLQLLKHAAEKGKPILLSTGMCDLADIHEALEVVRSAGGPGVVLLQCTSLYPTEPRHVHLRAMDTLAAAFSVPVGLSDHTTGVFVPVAAAARGACVIEKHLTLDRTLPGPDHGYALEPDEFAEMVRGIRETEAALGSAVKQMLPEEAVLARRPSIRAARDIQAGEVLTSEAIVFERPAHGLRPRFAAALLGRPARNAIVAGEAITWEMV